MTELQDQVIRCQQAAGATVDQVTITLDSCNSTWSFQPAKMRFRRTLKGLGMDVRTGWRHYYGLRFDDGSDGFTVLLNEEGTRLLRSWCHWPGEDTCENCAACPDSEVSLDHPGEPEA